MARPPSSHSYVGQALSRPAAPRWAFWPLAPLRRPAFYLAWALPFLAAAWARQVLPRSPPGPTENAHLLVPCVARKRSPSPFVSRSAFPRRPAPRGARFRLPRHPVCAVLWRPPAGSPPASGPSIRPVGLLPSAGTSLAVLPARWRSRKRGGRHVMRGPVDDALRACTRMWFDLVPPWLWCRECVCLRQVSWASFATLPRRPRRRCSHSAPPLCPSLSGSPVRLHGCL